MNCAVVIPIYRKPTPSERLSLKIAQSVLASHSLYLAMPESLDFRAMGFDIRLFPDHYFYSIKDYGALMVDKIFYEAFQGFEYVLIYQLDCLVFADKLERFCSLGCDYIAPVIFGRSDGFWPLDDIVGIGGFSLRKVSSFLGILSLLDKPEYSSHAKNLSERIGRNGAEDMFWSLAAPEIDPAFIVASPDIALSFGFEGDPNQNFHKANRQQPFGCHHWNRLSYFLWYLPWIKMEPLIWVRVVFCIIIELMFMEAKLFTDRLSSKLGTL